MQTGSTWKMDNYFETGLVSETEPEKQFGRTRISTKSARNGSPKSVTASLKQNNQSPAAKQHSPRSNQQSKTETHFAARLDVNCQYDKCHESGAVSFSPRKLRYSAAATHGMASSGKKFTRSPSPNTVEKLAMKSVRYTKGMAKQDEDDVINAPKCSPELNFETGELNTSDTTQPKCTNEDENDRFVPANQSERDCGSTTCLDEYQEDIHTGGDKMIYHAGLQEYGIKSSDDDVDDVERGKEDKKSAKASVIDNDNRGLQVQQIMGEELLFHIRRNATERNDQGKIDCRPSDQFFTEQTFEDQAGSRQIPCNLEVQERSLTAHQDTVGQDETMLNFDDLKHGPIHTRECKVVEADSTEVDHHAIQFRQIVDAEGDIVSSMTGTDNTDLQQIDGDDMRHGQLDASVDTMKPAQYIRVGQSSFDMDQTMTPIRPIPALKMTSASQEKLVCDKVLYIPPDTTILYQPEEGVLKSKPVPKPTRGRRTGRRPAVTMTRLSSPAVYHHELQQVLTKSQPLYHLPHQRYIIPDTPASPIPPTTYYQEVTANPWGDYKIVHGPGAAGDMMGYSDIGSLVTSPLAQSVTPASHAAWYGFAPSDYIRGVHKWAGTGRGRGIPRAGLVRRPRVRGGGGVRQYLQHRLLWARYTGRSQEAVDRVLTIINNKRSNVKTEVNIQNKHLLPAKVWSDAEGIGCVEEAVFQGHDLQAVQQSSRGTNSILSQGKIGKNAVVDGNGYIVYLSKEDRSNFPKSSAPIHFMPEEAATFDARDHVEEEVETSALDQEPQEGCTPTDDNEDFEDGCPKWPRRVKTPVSPVKEPMKRPAPPFSAGQNKKKVRRSLTFPSPTKEEEETRTATESIAKTMTNAAEMEMSGSGIGVLPTATNTVQAAPRLLQSAGSTGISINIHVTNDMSRSTITENKQMPYSETTQESACRPEGSSIVCGPLPRYNMGWHRSYQSPGLVQRPYDYQQVQILPGTATQFRYPYRNPKATMSYCAQERNVPAGLDRYYTAEYASARDWVGAYPAYMAEHVPLYKAHTAAPPAYANPQAAPTWSRKADVLERFRETATSTARPSQSQDRNTSYSFYQNTAGGPYGIAYAETGLPSRMAEYPDFATVGYATKYKLPPSETVTSSTRPSEDDYSHWSRDNTEATLLDEDGNVLDQEKDVQEMEEADVEETAEQCGVQDSTQLDDPTLC